MKPKNKKRKTAYKLFGLVLSSSMIILWGLSYTSLNDEKRSGIKVEKIFQLKILGQALIEHDLRKHSDFAVKQAAEYLKGADVCFSNLEVAIKSKYGGERTKEGIYFHAAEPDVLDCLKEMGIIMVALSNNHAWDFGTQGLLGTIKEVEKRGFVHAGTGETIEAASMPGYLDTSKGRIALIAMASGKFPQEAVAKENHPGVNVLRLEEDGNLNQDDSLRNLDSIKSAAAKADYVLVYHHNHYWESDKTKTPKWQRQWARTCIHAGATVFIGHGVPLLHGIEIYKECPIFYSLGNFIFHTKTDVGHYEDAVWQSVVADCHFQQGKLTAIKFRPLVLNEKGIKGDLFYITRGVPQLAKGKKASTILNRLSDISKAFGTDIHIADDYAEIRLE